jgi:hypothetical protein
MASPYFSHYLCMIGLFCEEAFCFFAGALRRGVRTRESCWNFYGLRGRDERKNGLDEEAKMSARPQAGLLSSFQATRDFSYLSSTAKRSVIFAGLCVCLG